MFSEGQTVEATVDKTAKSTDSSSVYLPLGFLSFVITFLIAFGEPISAFSIIDKSENSKYVDFFGMAGNNTPSWDSEAVEVSFSFSDTELALSEISTTGTTSSSSSEESELAQEKMAKRKIKIEAKMK